MNNTLPIRDIKDINVELASLNEQFHSLYNKMLAIAMDYKSYFDPKVSDNEIYEIRNSVNYRLSSAKFHFELLMRIIINTDQELTVSHRKTSSNPNYLGPNFLFDNRVRQVSYLSDSIFFHLVSGFDYISNLVEYICGGKKQKDFKWTQLSRSARDQKKSFSKKSVAKTITKLDREFVSKLYDHRSYLIHSNIDKRPTSFIINLMEESCKTHVFSSSSFNSKFYELKIESKVYNITIQYALLWIIKKSISSLIEILFSLKNYMEDNKKVTKLYMFINGPNGEMLPVSGPYWNEKPSITTK